MRLSTALLLALMSLSAVADDLQTKVDEFIAEAVSGQNWEKRQKLLGSLRKAPGAAKAFLVAAAGRADLADSGWSLSSAAQPLLDSKRDEIVDTLKELMQDADPNKVRFAASVIQSTGLAAAMAPELLAAVRKGDRGAADMAVSVLSQCRDPRVIALLAKESEAKGEAGLRALRILAQTGASSAKDRLRAVAAEVKEPEERRAEAISGLSRSATEEDVKLAVAVLKEDRDRVTDAALNLLVEARAVVPADTLKALRRPDDEWRGSILDRLLSLAGEEEGANACLRRAGGAGDYEKSEWYAWAGRSGQKSARESLEKAFGTETNEDVRMGILVGIGECGDAGSVELIAKYVTHPQLANSAMKALGALGRRTPAALDGVLDRLVELTGFTTAGGIESYSYVYLEHATGKLRVALIDAYLRLLDRVGDRPRLRQSILSVVSEMTRPDFEQAEDAVDAWKAWWKANREEFEKHPPKVQR